MTSFLILGALLLALALAFILPPLLARPRGVAAPARRDQVNLAVLRDQSRELDADLADGLIAADAYRSARQELERRVAEDVAPVAAPTDADAGAGLRRQAGALGLAVVLGASGLYAALGTPRGLDPAQVGVAEQAQLTRQQAEAMVERLARRMQDEPGNADGWWLLARSYTALRRYAEAGHAYAQLLTLVPNDAGALSSYADVLALAQGKSLKGEPEQLLRRALALDPQDVKALILLGSAQFEQAQYGAAIATWGKIEDLVSADSDVWRLAASNIADAQARLAGAASAVQGGTQ